jgi:hypothetical protein
MAAKRCPVCNLVNPKSALLCDCGWSFAQQTMTDRPLVVAGREHPPAVIPRGLRWLPGASIVLTGGLIVQFVRWLYRGHVRRRQERRAKQLEAVARAVVLPRERRD